jgi:hypothetical protein
VYGTESRRPSIKISSPRFFSRLCYIPRISKGCDPLKAIIVTQYGPPLEVLQLGEVETPEPAEDEVLIRLYASFSFPSLGGSSNRNTRLRALTLQGELNRLGRT